MIDLGEDILKLVELADIIFWPVAIDFKYKDIEAMQDGEITATLINGAVRTGEQEEIAGMLRKKSKLVIAHGSCAHLGGVVGLANFYGSQELLNRAYGGKELKVSNFYGTVKTLGQVIEVDYYIPGCPPPAELIKNALMAILEDKLPAKGSVLAQDKALCDSCSRRDSRPDKLKVKKFKRIHKTEWDPAKCFLDQEIICLGPATRGGCKERCIKANMPCRGCFGPLDKTIDQGAKALSFLASIIDSCQEKEINKIAGSIADPAGLFYNYSLASSIFGGKSKTK